MTIQEKYKRLLTEIRDVTRDSEYNWFNFLDPEGLTVGEDVYINDDILQDLEPKIPMTVDDNCFAIISVSEDLKLRYGWYTAYEPTKNGLAVAVLNPLPNAIGDTRVFVHGSVGCRTLDNANHNNTVRLEYYKNSDFLYGSYSSMTLNPVFADIAVEMNRAIVPQPALHGMPLNIEKCTVPLVILVPEFFSLIDLQNLTRSGTSFQEWEENEPALFTKFKHCCLNYDIDTEPEVTRKRYYYRNKTYKTNSTKSSKTLLSKAEADIFVEDGYRISGYLSDNAPYNIVLKTTAPIMEWHDKIEGTTETVADFPEYNLTYSKLIHSGTNFYYGYWNSNIPIFATRAESDLYNNGLIDDSSALNNGGDGQDIDSLSGESVDNTPIDGYNTGIYLDDGYCTTHIMTSSQIREVFRLLYSETTNPWEQIKEGLAFYGESPVESLISLYYTPLDLSQFGIFSAQSYVMWGRYKMDTSEHNVLQSSGKIVELVNEPIMPSFNDYRDYTNTNLYLYLPFVGIVSLDCQTYMNNVLSVKCTYDIKSHNIKYWLFSNDCLTDQYEASLGVSFPIMATDTAGKAMENIQAITDLASRGLDIAGGVAGAAAGGVGFGAGLETAEEMNIAYAQSSMSGVNTGIGMSGTAIGSIRDIINLSSNPQKIVKGNQSSNTACYDPKIPYLIYEYHHTSEPIGLKENYGKPTNTITTLNNLHGFAVVDDIQLKTKATAEEEAEIKQILAGGVYF